MDWITTEAAAALMGVTAIRVRQLIAEGRLKHRKIGPIYVVSAKSAKSFKRLKRGPKPKK